ncbi:hypothetical protein B0J11DRAFT_525623 [Dendryphion nanum]|uniref:Uncharacterized protein n=1 Tax=Dendryphion nanum TaxID=256645 RepID=A0A9P9IQE6_9PLEO|nr:hypothetical protein B0J11DRAFT_525623 [Dendryphion nanum]
MRPPYHHYRHHHHHHHPYNFPTRNTLQPRFIILSLLTLSHFLTINTSTNQQSIKMSMAMSLQIFKTLIQLASSPSSSRETSRSSSPTPSSPLSPRTPLLSKQHQHQHHRRSSDPVPAITVTTVELTDFEEPKMMRRSSAVKHRRSRSVGETLYFTS